jgi:hypothetical protein
MCNVDDTLKSVESHNKKALHGSLLRGVVRGTIQKYFTSVQHRYASNSKVPSYVGSPSFQNAGLFTEKYSSGVKRKKLHTGEIDAQLHRCTTVEFTQHSGDTSETYYRTDSKVLFVVLSPHTTSDHASYYTSHRFSYSCRFAGLNYLTRNVAHSRDRILSFRMRRFSCHSDLIPQLGSCRSRGGK